MEVIVKYDDGSESIFKPKSLIAVLEDESGAAKFLHTCDLKFLLAASKYLDAIVAREINEVIKA